MTGQQEQTAGVWDARAMHEERSSGQIPIDVPRLKSWLREQGMSDDLADLQLVAGGSQNIVLRATIDGRRLILRYPPVHPRPHSNRALVREMQVLSALAPTDVPHPRFVAGQDDLESDEPVFYLMDEVDGFNPHVEVGDRYRDDPDFVRTASLSIPESLARLGLVDPAAIGLTDFGRPDTFRERQIDKQLALWKGFTERAGYDAGWLGAVPSVADWLHESMPPASAPGLAHGDFQLGNLMLSWDEPRVAAILDWEMCTGGDPLIDLGYLLLCWPDPVAPAVLPTGTYLAELPGFPRRFEVVDEYARVTNRDMSRVDWHVALAAFKMGVIIEANYVRSTEGKLDPKLGDYSHRVARELLQAATAIAQGSWAGLDR